MKANRYFLVAIIILMALLIFWSLTYPALETKLLPIIFCTTVLVLAVAELWREGRGEKGAKNTSAERTAGPVKEAVSNHIKIAAWVVGLFLGIYLLGFFVAIPVFIFLYLCLHGKRWIVAIGLAALMEAVIYGLFTVALRIDLYRGLLFP